MVPCGLNAEVSHFLGGVSFVWKLLRVGVYRLCAHAHAMTYFFAVNNLGICFLVILNFLSIFSLYDACMMRVVFQSLTVICQFTSEGF